MRRSAVKKIWGEGEVTTIFFWRGDLIFNRWIRNIRKRGVLYQKGVEKNRVGGGKVILKETMSAEKYVV